MAKKVKAKTVASVASRTLTRRSRTAKESVALAASTLSQADAEKFGVSAQKYADKATSSKKKAQDVLVDLGIHTKTGQLAKRYR